MLKKCRTAASVFMMALSLSVAFPSTVAAATLKGCRGVATENGFKFVGVYCVDFSCQVTTTRMFDQWCPYNVSI